MFIICLQCFGGIFILFMKFIKDYFDEVINFMRSYLFMYQVVYFLQRRFLVVRIGVFYRFIIVVVDQVDVVDGRYEVFFLGIGIYCCFQFFLRWVYWVEGVDLWGWDLFCWGLLQVC